MAAWKSFYRKNSEKISIEYDDILVNRQTDIQHLEILVTKTFGQAIFMDHCPEMSFVDSSSYHESLIHPSFMVKENIETIFIAGGGEGVLLKELLKYPSVKRIVQCDIDRTAIKIFKENLQYWHEGAYDSEKVELVYDDARSFLENCNCKFDLIITDITAPINGGSSYTLFTLEYYKIAKSRLNEKGIFTCQAQSINRNNLVCFSVIFNTLSRVYRYVTPLHAPFSLIGDEWGFLFCSDYYQPKNLITKEIDNKIRKNNLDLEFYSGETHLYMFNFPTYFYKTIKGIPSISTDNSPFYYNKILD